MGVPQLNNVVEGEMFETLTLQIMEEMEITGVYSLDRLQQLSGLERNQILRCWDFLESIGEGVVVLGRRGASTRFVTLDCWRGEAKPVLDRLAGVIRIRYNKGMSVDHGKHMRFINNR